MTATADRTRATRMLEAALAHDTEVLDAAWREWRRRCPDLEGMQPEEYRLLPFVWRRVERAGIAAEDPDAGRLRGLLRKAWFHNQHLLQESALAQETLASAGIESLLGRECGLLAAWPDAFGSMSTIAVDLLVAPRDLERASRLLASRRPSRWRDAGRVSLRAAGMDPLHVQAWTARDASRRVLHGARPLQVAGTIELLASWLGDLFARTPPVVLPPGRWAVDLDIALRQAGLEGADPGEGLLARFVEAGDGPLLRVHAVAALEVLGDLAPPFLVRAAALVPRPSEEATLRALEAFPSHLAGSVEGEAAWWLARHGLDAQAAGPVARLAWLRVRVGDLLRNVAADRDYRARVAAAPGRYLRSALGVLMRR